MAWANLSPPEQAQSEREKSLIRRLNSVDPVTRYNAREEAFSGAMLEASNTLVRQAEANARQFQREQAEYEKRQNSKFKPLPYGTTNIIKGDN